MKIEIEKSPRRERYAYGRRSIVSPLSPHAGIQSVIECDYDPQGWIFWKKKETVSCRLSRHAAGRWLSRDPIEEQGGLNLYAFVGNVPTSFVDNQGGFAVAIGGVIGGSFLVPGLIGIGIGAAVVVSAGIVVIGSAIIIDRIIDSLPQTETSLEEEAKTSDDAIPITQCPPCPDRKKRCAPCNPPVDTVMYRHDTTGRPHYVPETGKRELPHYNNYVVYQVPYKEGNPHSCECRYREIDATLVPLAGATPFRRPTGGGVIIM